MPRDEAGRAGSDRAEHALGEETEALAADDHTSRSGNPDTTAPMFVVGIGASAGGLKSLEEFFGNMPRDTGCSFVVVQHLSPDFKSLMQELLSRHTQMAVHKVEEGMKLERNALYLIPPKNNMVVRDGALHLIERGRPTEYQPNFPIDVFLQSLAKDIGHRAIAIILSGTGSDGSRGIMEINEAGGIVLVQDPDTAEFDGMPLAAIGTSLADRVLSPRDLAEAVCDIVSRARVSGEEQSGDFARIDDHMLSQIIGVLALDARNDFRQYRPGTLLRRIERRRIMARCEDVAAYTELLKKSPEERQELRSDLLIKVTGFFRDPEAWHELTQQVLPRLVMDAPEDEPLRIWVTACSTGEEAYSVAIAASEVIEHLQRSIDVKVFATDVDGDSLNVATAGVYPATIADDMSPERLQKYFERRGGNYHIAHRIRKMIVFANHDLTKDAPFTRMSLVTCRNLLIYLQPTLQESVLRNLHFALVHRGVLWLGGSETLAALEHEFEPIDRRWRLYAKKRDIRLPLAGPLAVSGQQPYRVRRAPGGNENTRRRQAEIVAAEAFAALMKRKRAACMLVSVDRELLHMVADPIDLLRIPAGHATQDVTRLVPPSVTLPLNTAIQRAVAKKESVSYEGVRLDGQGDGAGIVDAEAVDIHVSFHWAGRTTPDYLIVTIEPSAKTSETLPKAHFDPESVAAQRIADLEHELQQSKESLQATIEELETTNEEQQATNEELVSSNEELQSTNEELHSVNEELYTVNAEYQQKIHELSQLNADMDSLLQSTQIGTVFLDESLCIRKYTPAATEAIHLVESDIGRPIEHLTHRLDYGDFLTDVRRTLEHASPCEREASNQDGQQMLVRMHPYIGDAASGGVVITFVDITRQKQAEEALESSAVDLRIRLAAMEAAHDMIVITDSDAVIKYVNPSFTRITGYTRAEVAGQTPRILKSGEHDAAFYTEMWATIKSGNVWQGTIINRRKDGSVYHERQTITPVMDPTDQTIAHFVAIKQQLPDPA